MSSPEVLHNSGKDLLKFAIAIVSGALGLSGTWLMSRRYVKKFKEGVLYALVAPLLMLVGKGKAFRTFLTENAKDNSDIPDSTADMVIGVILLFWSFFLQLMLPWFDLK